MPLSPQFLKFLTYRNFSLPHYHSQVLSFLTLVELLRKLWPVTGSYLLSLLTHYWLLDQYAFKPTNSTTAVLVHFTRHITRLLEYNQYVSCLMIDFSKASDTVNHVIMDARSAMRPCYILPMFFYIFFLWPP